MSLDNSGVNSSTVANDETPAILNPPQDNATETLGKRRLLTVYVGLLLGMLVMSSNMSIVLPAMPRIVADLGGLELFSWVITAVTMTSTVISPIFGRLSDIYGRKPFYLTGICLFLIGSAIAGTAPNVWFLILGRVVQGAGLGMTGPMSMLIMADLVSPRERGKYQGPMMAVFGISSILGPTIGGAVTDYLGWRWLFFVTYPIAILALAFAFLFMRLPHVKRAHAIDYPGIALVASGLICFQLAIVWMGNKYSWDSPVILGLLLAAAVLFAGFAFAETRAREPVLPLSLFRNSIFTFSTIAASMMSVANFGAIYFVPMFVQGVLGNTATHSGATLIPMSIASMSMGIIGGQTIARTGRYKPFTVGGIALGAFGFYLLTRMDPATTAETVALNLFVIGLGLGSAQNTLMLIVQNAVEHQHLGAATAGAQLFSSVGSTTGLTLLGTVLASQLSVEVPRRLPAESLSGIGPQLSVVLDPIFVAKLPPSAVAALHEGVTAALNSVYWTVVIALAISFVAALLTREIPLRTTVRGAAYHSEESSRRSSEQSVLAEKRG
jgi:EmrB/QacA subfamily drug resistance transporter